MKKTTKNTRDEYTLFQDIMDTYRYPDGTLNKIAVFISTLALILLVTAGHFIINGIKSINKLDTVTASELTIDEIQDYITSAYLEAIGEHADGNINQDLAKEKILQMLAEYLESSNGFTKQQQDALNRIMEEYISNSTIYSDMAQNSNDIKNISNIIEKKFSDNKEYISQIQQLLQNEINANTNIDETHFKELNEQIEQLQNYTNNQMAANHSDLNSMINELRRTYENSLGAKEYNPENVYNAGDYVIYNEHLYISTVDNNTSTPDDSNSWKLSDLDEIINNLEQSTFAEMQKIYNDLTNQLNETNQHFNDEITTVNETINNQGDAFQAQIDAINDLLHDNNNNFEFGYDSATGAYGYYVNSQFKPF